MGSSTDGEENSDSKNKTKRKVEINKKILENLTAKCEWKNCDVQLPKSRRQFYNHVSSHLHEYGASNSVMIKEENFKCHWSTCIFITDDGKEIVKHVKYHAYLAELRSLGAEVSKISELPPCTIQSEYHVFNHVDENPLICLWDNCSEYCIGIQEFIDHVFYHVKLLPASGEFKCLWIDCGSHFPKRSKLTDHLKTHTKNHFIACPHCGHTFANKTKFADHCLTQKPLEEHVYQCDYCLSYHPTERILRKHMGQHIHHYKCPFCNMTCNKPSLLCKHVRYRHLNHKSFKCSLCNYMCKSKSDLQAHILSHVTGFMACQESGCDYSTTSQLSLKKHIEVVHVAGKQPGLFCCHICDKKFTRGVKLTSHLAKKHNLKKPPGYSRFQYKLEGDGCRRLQSVRLESLDIHEISDFVIEEEPMETAGESLTNQHNGSDLSKAVTVDVLNESGKVISSSIVIPEDSLPPVDAQILAIGT